MDRGFDHFFGFLNGFTDHFAGSDSYRLDREPFRDFGPDYYSSDAFTDRAIQFIRVCTGARCEASRFMLYLSYQAPHNPLQAPRADILKHRGKYLQGWQAIREARFRRQKELGIVPADADCRTTLGICRIGIHSLPRNAIWKTCGWRSTRRWSSEWIRALGG